jgi:predicted 3-demethylubiquinone-9 3-methyltransferase (glyoxalase superfamily)
MLLWWRVQLFKPHSAYSIRNNRLLFFTNNQNVYSKLEGTKWIRIFIDTIPIHNNSIHDTLSTKEIRACPHRFPVLDQYEYLCWFDTKLKVYEEVVERYIELLQASNKTMVLTKHAYSDKYTTVWDEFHTAMGIEKYRIQKDKYEAYIKHQLANGYDETISVFYCCGFSLRKRCDQQKEINELWYKHIQECGIEDQISFQFIQKLYGDSIHGLAYQESWKYFYE